MTIQGVTPSEETDSPDEAGCPGFQKVKALAAGALDLRDPRTAVPAVLLQGKLGGPAGSPEPPCEPPQDYMQCWVEPALDSLLALLPSLLALLPSLLAHLPSLLALLPSLLALLPSLLALLSSVLQEHQQLAVRSETAQGWSVASQETSDCWARAAAAVQMACLLVPQAGRVRKVLADAQALGLLSAHRRACMRY